MGRIRHRALVNTSYANPRCVRMRVQTSVRSSQRRCHHDDASPGDAHVCQLIWPDEKSDVKRVEKSANAQAKNLAVPVKFAGCADAPWARLPDL